MIFITNLGGIVKQFEISVPYLGPSYKSVTAQKSAIRAPSIWQNLQENPRVGASFLKILQNKRVCMNFAKFLRTHFLQNKFTRLLLDIINIWQGLKYAFRLWCSKSLCESSKGSSIQYVSKLFQGTGISLGWQSAKFEGSLSTFTKKVIAWAFLSRKAADKVLIWLMCIPDEFQRPETQNYSEILRGARRSLDSVKTRIYCIL